MINYVWDIGPLDVKLSEDGLTKVVYNVNWRLIGTDGDYSVSVYGSCGIPAPTENSFTSYEQLTKEQVQSWVEEILGAEQIASYKAGLASNIEIQKNPVEVSLQPPWVVG